MDLPPLQWLVLALVGFVAGGFGVVVGAGGGFIIAPLLLILYHFSPPIAAGTSLTIVLLNTLSGSMAYARQGWVNYRAGLMIAIPAAPGALAGAAAARFVSPTLFRTSFAVTLLVFAAYLLRRPEPTHQRSTAPAVAADHVPTAAAALGQAARLSPGLLALGVALGFVSSFFGLGAGWLVVPLLVHVYRFPPHVAAATSIFALAVYSFVGVTVYVSQGHVFWPAVVAAGAGVIVAAQVGAGLSTSLKGVTRVRLLALAMGVVGVGLLVR